MSDRRFPRRVGILAAAVFIAVSASAAAGFQQTPPSDAQLLKDFIHFTLIHDYELADSNARALLDRGLTAPALVDLVENSGEAQRFQDTIILAQRVEGLEGSAGELLIKYERGKLERARDPGEIARNITLLSGTQRQRLFARERLIFAGEYATPQLLQAVLQRNDPVLSDQASSVLVDMGRQAVVPLVTALPALNAAAQADLIRLLGLIPYRTTVPHLYDVREQSANEQVRAAAMAAIQRIDGTVYPSPDISDLYRGLADAYYQESPSLTSFPDEEYQLLWSYDPGLGLIPTAVATPVYHEAMTMLLTERALRRNSQNSTALALWLAANFSREIDSPEAYENPAYGPERRDAMYYAVAAGAAASQRVLARALDDRDTPLARLAIAAVEQTAGGTALWSGIPDRMPLLEALSYPNRRVQYEAALAIGAAQPLSAFAGSDRVVPILASAIRDAAARYAVVLGSTVERQNSLADALRAAGYTVLSPGARMADVEAPIAEAPGVDLIVIDLPSGATRETITRIRGRSDIGAVPVLALMSAQGYTDLAAAYDRDALTRVARAGVSADQLVAAVDQLVETAAGGRVSAEDAAAYKVRSLAVLRDLAVSQNPVLTVADAASALLAALPAHAGAIKLEIAEVLAHVGSKRVQVAMLDDALAASGPARVELLGKVADSAKRFGNLLEQRQVGRLVQLAREGGEEEATAAAALMGALDLPNADLIPLILGE